MCRGTEPETKDTSDAKKEREGASEKAASAEMIYFQFFGSPNRCIACVVERGKVRRRDVGLQRLRLS
jgi:hypothetical protein